MDDLILKVYPEIEDLLQKNCERAVVATKNYSGEEINEAICNKINSEGRTYKSIDTVVNEDDAVHFPSELPPKLCNGTRLQVNRLLPNVIEAVILAGTAAGETAFVPRIPMTPSDLPFQFKRVQFPVRVCFAMTINKAQGQSFNVVGVDLRNEVFMHGQLYVGLSHIGKASNQFVLIPKDTCMTQNVVYSEVFAD